MTLGVKGGLKEEQVSRTAVTLEPGVMEDVLAEPRESVTVVGETPGEPRESMTVAEELQAESRTRESVTLGEELQVESM